MFLEAIMRLQPQYADFGPANPILLSNGVNANGVPDPIVLAEMVTLIHSSLKDTTVNYGFEMNIPFCLIDQKVKSELLRDGKMRRACHIPTGSGLIFDESGAVLPCNFFSTHTLGKYPTDFSGPENFGAFWANKEVRAFRSLVASYPSTKCVSCREWDMCGGGCVIKWLYWDPKEYIKGYTD
jgi:radical SAM protein with 4Fe4S-binding SPASM domain